MELSVAERISLDQAVASITQHARDVEEQALFVMERNAHQSIVHHVFNTMRLIEQDIQDRHSFITNSSITSNNNNNNNKSSIQSQQPSSDPSFTSLSQIISSADDDIVYAALPSQARGPNYDTWIPILLNYYVKSPDLDMHHPYFGESKTSVSRAKDVFQELVEDAKDDNLLHYFSDSASRQVSTRNYYALEHHRRRSARRNAIVKLVEQFGNVEHVWFAMKDAYALEIGTLILYYRIAHRRIRIKHEIEERRKRVKSSDEDLAHVLLPSSKSSSSNPSSDDSHAYLEDHSKGALEHFCFTCNTFTCPLHEGQNVEPWVPIPDRAVASRRVALDRRKACPCSIRCFLTPSWQSCRKDSQEGKPWSTEEVQILREAYALFGKDPCAMATLVGSKTCREVFTKIATSEEQEKLNQISLRVVEQQDHRNPSQFVNTAEATPVKRRAQTRKRKGSKKSPKQRPTNKDEGHVELDFVPCNHPGECSLRNGCICVKNDFFCESTCACNCGRFCEDENGVVVWTAPAGKGERDGMARVCQKRFKGCECRSGHCKSEACPCYVEHRVCNPDVCKNCGCEWLPGDISFQERRCRNVNLTTGTHKHTVAGASKVHGFGLFAAATFHKGDMIGHYTGRTVPTDIVDRMLRISQARNITYAFDITKQIAIDGLCFGGKVRYINHSKEGANCESRFTRVRGEGRIEIIALRTIHVGEEFLFDYKITRGNEWLQPALSDSDSDPGSSVVEEMIETPDVTPRKSARKTPRISA